jgi:polyhydroxyalkanoate synthesis regulator phasin
MPPAKRATSSSSKSSKPAAKRASGSRATNAAASSGAKATATSASKAAGRASTQAKSAATRTRKAAAGGAATTRRSARSGGAGTAAKSAGAAAASTARTARSGAKGTATAAKRGAKNTRSQAKAAATSTRRASDGDGSVAEQLVKGTIRPQDVVMLTRDRIRETLDDAASRGRVTRKDADDLVTELVRRGRSQSGDVRAEIDSLLGRVETATKRARNSKPVDRLVRGADRARRAAGVGPSFPIIDYDNLNVAQVQSRLTDLGKPELRKVLTYERKHANRKTVVGAIEKSLS